ncbi:DUF4145 domain-containing protein [uncultured Trichococcus sp.]|uniref:DUF4145 domain-containing protein n=1 Tax=Trichococcus flocculiformis TaxID=82803 RepID=UPI0029C01C9B|nr:DUF4145 domain-containing protein [uncultured Trichococcus sp.]
MNIYKRVPFNNNSYTITTTISIQIPSLCPHCAVSNNPVNELLFVQTLDSLNFIGIKHRCTACNKHSFTLQTVAEKAGSIVSEYPSARSQIFDEKIETLSPRFVNIYNQAYAAEQMNHIELAGMGYRSAMEILIKDYALSFELASKADISKNNLNRSIETYFKDDQHSFISADVVRMFGNGFTHWDQDEESLSLEELKAYLEIFIQAILIKLMIKYPPVSRIRKN